MEQNSLVAGCCVDAADVELELLGMVILKHESEIIDSIQLQVSADFIMRFLLITNPIGCQQSMHVHLLVITIYVQLNNSNYLLNGLLNGLLL